MTILDTILFGMLAGAITLKAALLATAAVLLVYALTAPFRRAIPMATAKSKSLRLTFQENSPV